MDRQIVELPTRFFTEGEMRIWSEPSSNRSTIEFRCDSKDSEINPTVRRELRRIHSRDVGEPFRKRCSCQIWTDMVRLEFPTKDLPHWVDLMWDVCERQKPPLIRPKRRRSNGNNQE